MQRKDERGGILTVNIKFIHTPDIQFKNFQQAPLIQSQETQKTWYEMPHYHVVIPQLLNIV